MIDSMPAWRPAFQTTEKNIFSMQCQVANYPSRPKMKNRETWLRIGPVFTAPFWSVTMVDADVFAKDMLL